MTRVAGFLKRYFAVLVVGTTYLWAVSAIVSYRAAEAPPGTITLRLGHWQLEASVRQALDELAADYSAQRVAQGLSPVKITQDAIPEMTYVQWLTTQLMGGTAPDMLEVGLGTMPYYLWLQYFNRYFIPLTREVNQPNPYNADTPLEGVPLRLTFKDGMREAYVEEMQEYMSVPLSQFGVRIFYNRNLLKRLTGLDAPPTDYRGFLAVCRQIKSAHDERGQPYAPIAGSKYHLGWWEGPMMDPLTYTVKDVADFNRDGFVDNGEQFVAIKTGRLDFHHPAVAARYRMLWELTEYFQVGFTGLSRDEALLLFAQERAVFMTTGTWEARSLLEQAEGYFDVGVMDYPMPSPDDPEYGAVMRGPNYERIGGGARFGITRSCAHPDIALDFLRFITSRAHNEKLNAIIGWIPSVRETQMPPFLRGFEPHLKGVYGNFNPGGLGGETAIKWMQIYAEYQIKRKTYDQVVESFEPFYKTRGMVDFMDTQKEWRRALHDNEQFLAGIRAQALRAEGDAAVSDWVKYRILTTNRQIWPEIFHTRQMKLVTGELALPDHGPYEYSERVLNKVRARLERRADTPAPITSLNPAPEP
ncbi:MAG: ABC transporter substrate-binding protein [Lentisphaerae bacterium]|nr:ABC transporter substrate-binding protein [Lentisphaerota bacterium]